MRPVEVAPGEPSVCLYRYAEAQTGNASTIAVFLTRGTHARTPASKNYTPSRNYLDRATDRRIDLCQIRSDSISWVRRRTSSPRAAWGERAFLSTPHLLTSPRWAHCLRPREGHPIARAQWGPLRGRGPPEAHEVSEGWRRGRVIRRFAFVAGDSPMPAPLPTRFAIADASHRRFVRTAAEGRLCPLPVITGRDEVTAQRSGSLPKQDWHASMAR